MMASERLAAFIGTVRYQDLPTPVISATKRYLIDALGAAIAGAQSEPGRAVQAFLREVGGAGEATVIGTCLRVDCLNAAWGNGALMRALELEDTFDESFFHAAPGTIGAAVALAERATCTGRDLLTAIALGYEVGARVAKALAPSHAAQGYHPTATCGAFGAAAAAARLLGLSADQIASAFGIAGLRTAGLLQGEKPGWRHLTCVNGGSAAHLGVFAALLARHGFPGSPDVFEDPRGFTTKCSHSFQPHVITDELGSTFLMRTGGIKLYPSARPTHTSIAAALDLRTRHNINPQDIVKVTVRCTPEVARLTNKPDPSTVLDGQASHQFIVAVALAKGRYTVADLVSATLCEPVVRQLMARTCVEADHDLGEERLRQPSKWPAIVTVHTLDGAVYRAQVDYPPGSIYAPLSERDVWDKYRSLVEEVLPEQTARELWYAVSTLEQLDDVRPFLRLLEAPA